MATLTLRPTSGTGDSWTNVANVYDGNESTLSSVSTSIWTYEVDTLVLDFDTSVIPSEATINSATLTIRSKAGKNTVKAYVDINQNSANRVINQQQTTSVTNYTADVTNYMSDLTSVEVTAANSNWSYNTFELYELWIDIDYTASTTTTTYTITASVGTGGSITPSGATTILKGGSQTYTISANTGYRIKSVTVDGTDQGAITSYTFSNVTSDHTISAVFEQIPTYTVTFKDYDGSIIDTQTVPSGGSATPPTPTRTGYDFTGWSGGSYTNVTSNVVLIAQYSIKTFTVRFLDWNNDVLDTQTVDYGGSATPPPNPTRDGYTFSGWSGNYTNVTADVDIIAQYTQNSSGGDDASVKNIKIGNSTISKLYLGTSQIVKVYLGDVLIFGGSDSGGSGGEITGPETIVENFTPTEDVGWSYRISGINWANHRIKITFDGTNLNTTQGNTLFSLTNEDSDFASTIIDFYSDDGGKLLSYESNSTFSDNVIGQTTMYIDKSTIKVTCNGKTTTTYHSDDAEFQSYMNELKANDTIYIRKNPNEEFANISNITIVLEDMSNIGGDSA